MRFFSLTISFLLLFFLQKNAFSQQITSTTNGVVDARSGYYAFTGATIYQDYQTKLDNATLIIKEGKIVQVGANLPVPQGALEVKMNGKFIYPSFVDIYSDYGMPKRKEGEQPSYGNERFESNKKGAFAWNEQVKSEIHAEDLFTTQDKEAEELRKLGFGSVLTHTKDGIVRGTGAFLTLHSAKPQEIILKGRASSHFALERGTGAQTYPISYMGYVALIRQTYLDAEWYASQTDKKEYNISLDNFNQNKKYPAFFDVPNRIFALRADKIGKEFNANYILKGNGDEYQRLQDLKNLQKSFVIPLNFPENYDISDPIDAQMISLEELKHWELAPSNPARLQSAGINFALTVSGLKNKSDFLKNLQKAIQNGFSEKDALKALTFTPANMVGMDKQVGALRNGMVANFLITSKSIFDKESVMYENWVQGNRYNLQNAPTRDIRGIYAFNFGNQSGTLLIEGKPEMPIFQFQKLNDTLKTNVQGKWSGENLALTFKILEKVEKGKEKETQEKNANIPDIRLSGWADGKNWKGTGDLGNGQMINWNAIFQKEFVPKEDKKDEKKEDKKDEKPALGNVIYPFVAYGNEQLPAQESILFRNATVWTNEKEGVLKETDVLVQNGKIAQIGKNLSANGAKTVDATGKHLTTGIIDEHSHICLYSVNEIQSIASEVRMQDVVDSEDLSMYRQLAGGTTTAQLLHGSANCIGGQSAIIKFKWGENPDKLLVPYAVPFIKFALGENVKNSNAGSFGRERYPQTRMGVEQVMTDGFTRALEYQKRKTAKDPTLRKDLELETLLEILEKKRFITCHSYVQSEINMLMKVAEKFNFKINTFTHILEGYKVADIMAKHGAGASSFADWWAYKYEVKDAIPYNPALLNMNGVVTAINSDDAEMARRLNQEAAKAVKYGNVSEEDAWKMVTLNPAKLLHLDEKLGSMKIGKDADLVLWTDNPLSIYAVVEKTMVDGTIYFDKEKDLLKQKEIQTEKARIINLLRKSGGGEGGQKPMMKKNRDFHCDDLGEEAEKAINDK